MTLSPPYYNIQGPKANLFFEKLEKIFYGQTKVQKKQGVKLPPCSACRKKSGGLEKFPVQVYNRI